MTEKITVKEHIRNHLTLVLDSLLFVEVKELKAVRSLMKSFLRSLKKAGLVNDYVILMDIDSDDTIEIVFKETADGTVYTSIRCTIKTEYMDLQDIVS